MGEIRTVTTLRRKRDEISASIRLYEKQLSQARNDLAHITAVLRIFDASGSPKDMGRYVDHYRLFRRGEAWTPVHSSARMNILRLATTHLLPGIVPLEGVFSRIRNQRGGGKLGKGSIIPSLIPF
jgi:hypothetical protein